MALPVWVAPLTYCIDVAVELISRHVEQAAILVVFHHPQGAVRCHLNVADAVPHIPAFRGGRAALAVKGDVGRAPWWPGR